MTGRPRQLIWINATPAQFQDKQPAKKYNSEYLFSIRAYTGTGIAVYLKSSTLPNHSCQMFGPKASRYFFINRKANTLVPFREISLTCLYSTKKSEAFYINQKGESFFGQGNTILSRKSAGP